MKTSISIEMLKKKICIDIWRVELEANGNNIRPNRKKFSKEDISFYFDNENLRMDGVFEYIDNRLILNFTLENNGILPVSLGKVYPFIADSISSWEPENDVAVLASESHQTPRVIMQVDAPDVLHTGKIKLQFFNRTKSQALQFGFLGFRKTDTAASYKYDAKLGVHELKAYCDLAGWKLEPGKKVDLESFTLVSSQSCNVV